MKKMLVFSILTTFIWVNSIAQSTRYTEAMQRNISALDSAFTKESLLTAANNFERIGNAEKTEWLPFYYAGYSLAMYCYMEKDVSKIDALCDRADDNLGRAAAMQPDNSEITTVQAMVVTARMQVDMSRGMTLGPKSSGMLQAAMAQKPLGNPRTMMNLAQNLYYTPEAFGGSKAKAIEWMEKSVSAYTTFKPESPLHPNWGKEYVQQTLSQWKSSK